MGLDSLLAALEDDALEEIARLEAETRREVETILARAEEDARALEERIVRESAASAAAEAELRLRRARLEADRVRREARGAAFDDVLAAVRGQLAAAREAPDYPRVLRALVGEALLALPAGRTLRTDPRDEVAAGEALRLLGRSDVEVAASARTWGGVELAADDGRTLVNTLEERFANAEPLLRLRLAEVAGETAED